ncbi:MAG TPA: hypothetical protein VJT82_12340, partial [Pyrinomonadaceae bacterium]|nr:hypothetical protein [Pyrinomonadaceae bacterium]
LDDARQLWEGFNAAERREQRAVGEKLATRFLESKRFHDILQLHRELAAAGGTTTEAASERLLNGGFETGVGAPGKSLFDWQVVPVAGVQMGLDERVYHEGGRSLRLLFEAGATLNFKNISQLVAVEPQTRYRLEHYVRTEDLKSASTLVTEVVDAGDAEHILAASAPLAVGTEGWRQVALDFTTGAETEAITVRVVSPPCLAASCPIFGRVWYDDFNLQRIGGGGNTQGRSDARAVKR